MKIYDTSSYQVVHTVDFPAPVLSVGVSVSVMLQLLHSDTFCAFTCLITAGTHR